MWDLGWALGFGVSSLGCGASRSGAIGFGTSTRVPRCAAGDAGAAQVDVVTDDHCQRVPEAQEGAQEVNVHQEAKQSKRLNWLR